MNSDNSARPKMHPPHRCTGLVHQPTKYVPFTIIPPQPSTILYRKTRTIESFKGPSCRFQTNNICPKDLALVPVRCVTHHTLKCRFLYYSTSVYHNEESAVDSHTDTHTVSMTPFCNFEHREDAPLVYGSNSSVD